MKDLNDEEVWKYVGEHRSKIDKVLSFGRIIFQGKLNRETRSSGVEKFKSTHETQRQNTLVPGQGIQMFEFGKERFQLRQSLRERVSLRNSKRPECGNG